MIKVKVSNDGVVRTYQLEGKTGKWFNSNDEFVVSFDIENELQGLAEIVNNNIGYTIDIIQQEAIIKNETMDKMMESSKLEVKFQSPLYDEVGIVMLPTVICKKAGRVANIVDIDRGIIMREENK